MFMKYGSRIVKMGVGGTPTAWVLYICDVSLTRQDFPGVSSLGRGWLTEAIYIFMSAAATSYKAESSLFGVIDG